MKTVVAYFHELAGHERFMDMEPQAPDLDTLSALVVEEDGAPVAAEMTDEGVSLRINRPDEDAAARPSLRLTPRREPLVVHQDDILSADDDQDAPDVAAEHDATEMQAEDDAEAAEALTDEDATEAEEIDYVDNASAEQEPVPATDDSAEDDTETPFYDPATEQAASDQDDSVAAKLQRIRSLVGRAPSAAPAANTDQPDMAATPASVSRESVVDRLTALTGATPKRDEPETEDLVDDFDFKAEDASPLVLSNAEDSDEVDEEDADVATEDTPGEVEETTADEAVTDEAEDDDFDIVSAAKDEVARRRENLSKRENLPQNDDDAMSQIMSRADEKLNEPEGRRHRDAFAQLRAAVAATEAARQLGDKTEPADPKDAFREDLNEVQRDDDTAEADKGGAPLKLVPTQRVEDDTPSQPADRLRQIAAVKEVDTDQPEGFAEFATAHGATELGDLLEAAAAYIAYVEGEEDFSRPQVMKKVQLAAADEFSREDGLRSFGRLLRQSRIIKLSNGRFRVSEDTRFRPGTDKVAQG
ncbi:hypothetical protein [Yoonia sp. SS1-5]|uniref:Lipoprotein n=1 Tax=Yoonia rhodophyticola TaxID=3137370 RepID=A0AAN0M8I4_9RHOB